MTKGVAPTGNSAANPSRTDSPAGAWLDNYAVPVLLFLCVSAILLALFNQFSFFYFWWDDYHNLYWTQRTSYPDLFRHIMNPASHYLRPLGMLVYKIHFDLFHLNPLPYRITVFLLHALNVLLVFELLRQMIGSRYAAGFGALFFSYQVAYWHIFWQFGTIFELLAGNFFFLGILIFLRHGHCWPGILSASLLFFLAMRSKEMAITLPVVWLLYEIVVAEPGPRKQLPSPIHTRFYWLGRFRNWVLRFSLPAAFVGWFVYWKIATMDHSDPSMPYYMEMSPAALFRGFGWYLNTLWTVEWRPGAWIVLLILLLGTILFTRRRLALFFLLYVGLTFLPVIFFVNHRVEFFWYIPMLGVCGLLALAVKFAHERLSSLLTPRYMLAMQASVLIIAAGLHWNVQRHKSHGPLSWGTEVAVEYRQFVQGVKSLPAPAPGETLYFSSIPRYFDEETVMNAVQIALRRTDLDARVVTEFPPEARLRIRFENLTVHSEERAGN